MPQNILEWGIALILSMQGWGEWLVGPMNLFTFTGSAEFFLLIMPVVYWCWSSRLGLRLAVILLTNLALNLPLKTALHDPRPYWFDTRVQLWTLPETTFGIPSAHAQNAVIIWSMFAAHLQKGWIWAIAALIIFLTGLSRSFLGVHFPTDVFTGWGMGIILLILFLNYERQVEIWFKKMSEPLQIGLIFIISLGLTVIGAIIVAGVSTTFQVPAEWVQNAALQAPETPITPLSLTDLITVTGTAFGLIGGAIWLNTRFMFDAGGPWLKRLGRYVVGAVIVLILWQGLGIAFDLIANDESFFGYTLRYIRFTIVGCWISALGPLTFMRLKLAKNLVTVDR